MAVGETSQEGETRSPVLGKLPGEVPGLRAAEPGGRRRILRPSPILGEMLSDGFQDRLRRVTVLIEELLGPIDSGLVEL